MGNKGQPVSKQIQNTRDFIHGLSGCGPNTTWGRAGTREYEANQRRYYNVGGGGGGGRTRGGHVGVGTLLILGFIGLATYGYFQSDSDRSADRSRVSAARPARAEVPSPRGTSPGPRVRSHTEATRLLRLPDDARVSSLVDEVQQLSGWTVFVAEKRDRLFFEGNLAGDGRNAFQTSFNVDALDLARSAYDTSKRQLHIPCVADAECVAYRVFDGQTVKDGTRATRGSDYSSMDLWSESDVVARQIVQDFSRLQRLQQ